MSLRLRAVLMLGLIELLTLTAVIAAGMAHLRQDGYAAIRLRAKETGTLLRVAIGESLMVEHYSSVQEIIDAAFFDIDAVDYLAALDADGELIYAKRKGHDLSGEDQITLSLPVMVGDNILGMVELRFATDDLEEHLQMHLLKMLLLAGLGIGLSSLVTWAASSKIMHELWRVTGGLHNLAITGAADTLTPVPGTELGALVATYNAAVKRLQHHE